MQLLRKILWPFSLLYALGVHLRNLTYDLGWRPARKFSTPTVSVGNLSLGGTGKTPMIEWLVRNLSHLDRIAVLSRGYKRNTSGFVLANSSSTSRDIGDEPLQIYSKFPSIIMAADANRNRGISILEDKFHPDLILLDDAFQHRKVIPEFSILLTTFDLLYTEDWFLPTGTLRDSKSQAKRADIIVVTKCPSDLSEESMRDIRARLKPAAHQRVLFCTLVYSREVRGRLGTWVLDELKNKTVTLVTGIANPGPMLKYLSEHNIVVNHLKYQDHHSFTKAELTELSDQEWILTTEKDWVRGLKELDQAVYLEVGHSFLGTGKQQLLAALKKLER